MLMTEEIKEIKDKFIKVINASQELIPCQHNNIDPLFEQWYKAKGKFINAIARAKEHKPDCSDSNFIYEFPEMTFSLDLPTRRSKVNGWIEFINEYLDTQFAYSQNDDFCSFLQHNAEGFFENKVVSAWEVNGETIPVGMKLLKSFKFFFHGSLLEDIQNKASMVIQENTITGSLCVSVHPLDFLSASETTYDWRSCHALDGDYRSGNMAYMVDDCTVICYLKTDNNKILPRFPATVPWNSKKWRMYLFLNQEGNVIWAGRQYPYESQSLLDEVRQEIIPIITQTSLYTSMWYGGKVANFSEWKKEMIPIKYGRQEKYIEVTGLLFSKRSVITSDNTLFYNDLLYSTKYTPSYCYKTGVNMDYNLDDTLKQRSDLYSLHINIGKRPYCPCCGKNYVEFSDEMICPECDARYGTQDNDEYTVCNGCGRRIWREDAYWDENEEAYYCDRCWNGDDEY